ncbi:MAG TPA: Gfo/Idh/MocA family oxidoreductase [Chloroflexota bacterium]|jgi:predicted dehydrogenase|nr:Gfo/Idh/MocA family oxidoreductase [Chloroflexota bacterium]
MAGDAAGPRRGEAVKYAAVGCGGMGRRHLRGMARLYASTMCNMELVAVCDLNQDNANFLADEAKELLGTRPRVFAGVEEMVRQVPELQAADVTTDTGSHHAVATACLEAGLHVLCEKPLAVTVRGCNLAIEAARRHGRILSVAENYRRDPINRLIKALIDDGAIGTPRLMLETTIGGQDQVIITPWRHMKHTGTIVLDEGVHHADIIRYYLGEVRSVYGETRLHETVRRNTRSAGPGGFYARWSAGFPDTIEPSGEDALYAHITFDSGAIAHWINDHAGHGRGQRARFVYGSKGAIESPGDRNGRPVKLHLDGGTTINDAQILDYAPRYRLEPLAAELFGGERIWTYQLEFNDTDSRILALEYYELGRCIQTGTEPEVSGEEGRADVALNYGPFEAGRIGRAVTLEELIEGRVDGYQREIDRELGLIQE